MKDLIKKLSAKYKVVLVTGGAGAIGGNLLRFLVQGKFKIIVVIDNLSSGHLKNIPKDKKISFIKGDIADPKAISKVFKSPIDIIFHLAAHFANQNSIEHPIADLMSNGIGTINLLEASAKNKVKKFVYFSTSCIYKTKGQKLKESDLDLQFETPYAISKYIGEKYVSFYHHYYALPTVILRIFNSFGPGEWPGKYRNVIPIFLGRAINNQSLIITGTGKETRNFTFVDDIVRGTLLTAISKEAVGKVINLGGKREVSILGLANIVKRITKNKKKIIFKPRRKWDNSSYRCGDLRLAEKLLKFKTGTPLKVGLVKYHQWILGELGSEEL